MQYSPNCKVCGKGIVVASFPMERAAMNKVLVRCGWQVAPLYKCESCSNPMLLWERQRLAEYAKIDPLTLNNFKRQMIDKYGAKVERFL